MAASRRMKPRTGEYSIRLHKIPGQDRIDRKSLVDKTLPLQPFDLVGDIVHIELAVGIDIGAVADHLFEREIGVFGDDLQERPGALPSATTAKITS